MTLPINIKGVTTSLTRQLGGNIAKAERRTLTSKGYGQALKKILKTSSLDDAKKILKNAGLDTHRFSSHEAIKEKDLIKDLRLLSKAGVLKKPASDAISNIRNQQRQEHRQLTEREKIAFQHLTKNTKQELLWGQSSEKVHFSTGAQVAAERTKMRDIESRGMKFGIEGYEMLQDKDLGKKIKLLQDVGHKTEAMTTELEQLEMKAAEIQAQSVKDPHLAQEYGLVSVDRDTGKENHIKKMLNPDGSKTDEKNNSNEQEKENKTEDKKTVAQPTTTTPSGPSTDTTYMAPDENTVSAPFIQVKHKFSPTTTKINTNTINILDNQNKTTADENIKAVADQRQFGFINTSGDVKLD